MIVVSIRKRPSPACGGETFDDRRPIVDMRVAGDNVILTEGERDALLQAIESALEVHARPQFHAWVRGPFRALVPHGAMVGIELDDGGDVLRIECLRHAADAASPNLHDDDDGADSSAGDNLAVRMAAAFHGRPELPPTIAADLLDEVFGEVAAADALIHRTRFVSGAAFYFVLFAVPVDAGLRCRNHLRLLSSHLKMAWSRVIEMPVKPAAVGEAANCLTTREREILEWMARGLDNQAISAGLSISPLTLRAHIRKIYRKLDVDNRQAAIARTLQRRGAGRS